MFKCNCDGKWLCYFRQAGYVIVVVCMFVCQQLCAKTSERTCMKFSGKVGNGPLNKRLNFGGYPDRALAEVCTAPLLLLFNMFDVYN